MKIKTSFLFLIALNLAFFSFRIASPVYAKNFILDSSKVIARPWSLLSSIFTHWQLSHLAGNMFGLAFFGFVLEQLVGSKRFLQLYFAAGLAGSVACFFFYKASLGASAAVLGLIGALAVIRPKAGVIAFGIPMPALAAAFLWAGLSWLGLFNPGTVAHAAHLAGLATGVGIGFKWRKLFKKEERKEEEISKERLDKWEKRWMK